MISISILLFYPIPTRNTEIDLSEGFGIPKDPLIMGVTWVRFPSPAPILFVDSLHDRRGLWLTCLALEALGDIVRGDEMDCHFCTGDDGCLPGFGCG